MNDHEGRKIVFRLMLNGWVMFISLTVASLIFLPLRVTLGVAVGGLLVAINLTLLNRVVRKALAPGSRITPQSVLPKYYLTFAATCLIIFVLISQHLVDELGLLMGLSLFIVNVFIVVFHLAGKILYETITKEAA